MQASALPPADQLPAKVRAAADAAAKWTSERVTATATKEAAARAIPVAEQADVKAAAEALRAAKTDPGTPRTDTAKAERDAATRRHTLVCEALRQAEAELDRVVSAEADGWRAALTKQEADAQSEYLDAVDALTEARRRWLMTSGMRSWLADPTTSRFDARHADQGGWVRQLSTPNGTPPPFATVAAALRADVDPPKPRTLATPTQSQPMPQPDRAAASY